MKDGVLVSSSGTQSIPARIVEFAPGATGDVAPIRAVGGGGQSEMVTASGIAEDLDGYLYVASPVARSLCVFPPGANGDVPPFARLSGMGSGLTNPQGIAIHDGQLYVANGPFGPGAPGISSVAVFPLPLARGITDLAPISVIAGSATGLDSPFGLAVDASGNIYVANLNDTVTVYAPPAPSSYTDPDNASPTRTISDGLAGPEGLAIDGATLYVSNDNSSITVYSLPTGSPTAVIAGPTTTLDAPLGICVDSSGNILVVNAANQVLKFAAGAGGDAAPTATITGTSTTLDTAQFVVVSQ